MATKERFQNLVCGDIANLRLFTYNSNNRQNVQSIEKIEIYLIDPSVPEGAVLVETIDGSNVVAEDVGQYLLSLSLTNPTYGVGDYRDVWTITFENSDCAVATVINHFKIMPDLWFTTTTPPIYDFNFDFRPNKIRKGSKQYLTIKITPNVPRGSDIVKYYENLAVVSDIRVSIEIACGDCVPQEQDLRLIVERELINYREKGYAYYMLDTTDYECGIYNIWFELTFGECVYVSEKNSFQIYD